MRPRDEYQQRIYRKSSNIPWWQNACVRAYICDLFIVCMCARNLLRSTVMCMSVFFFVLLLFVRWFCVNSLCVCSLSIVVSFAMRLTAWIFRWKDRKRRTNTERMCLIYRRLACCLQSMAKIFRYYAYQGTYFAAILFTSMHLVGENAGWASTIDSITNPKPYPTRNI